VLRLQVPISEEKFNDETEEFYCDYYELELEHSLVSLSKWESKFEKPFLSQKEMTEEEVRWYIEAMTLTPNVPLEIYHKLSQKNYDDINAYLSAKMTATWFSEREGQSRGPSRDIVTAELIYYMMIAHNIPVEFENWHLNRLLTLIRVFNEKNKPQQKQSRTSRNEQLAQRRALNAQRQKEWGTTG
jgi:hypothetical protein